MSSIAPAPAKVLEPTNPINNNDNDKFQVPSNPVPNTNANRHFIDPKSYQGVNVEEEFKTCTLTSLYKLPQTWSESASGLLSIPYKSNAKTRGAHPYMPKFTTWIRVQNLPLFTSGTRTVKNSQAYLCGMVATAITTMIDDRIRSYEKLPSADKKMTRSYFAMVIDVNISSIKEHFIEFAVTHIGDNCLPFIDPAATSTPEVDRIYYPILMDRNSLHYATTDGAWEAMHNYTEAFSRQGKAGRRMMQQADRHYLADGLPSKCLNIQVVGWEQEGST